MRLPIAALAVVLTGCGAETLTGEPAGGGGEVSAPTTQEVPVAPPPSTVVHLTSQEKCLYPYTRPARIEASFEVAFKVQALSLCMTPDGSRTRLANDSSTLVWTIEQPPGLTWTTTPDRLPLRVELFRASLRPDPVGLPLEPGQSVTLDVTPGEIRMSTAAGPQATWEAVSGLVDEATEVSASLAFARLSRDTPERKAVRACGYGAFRVGSDLNDATSDPALELNGALGFAVDATETGIACADEVRQAQRGRAARSEQALLRVEPLKVRFNSAPVVSKTNQSMKQALIRGAKILAS